MPLYLLDTDHISLHQRGHPAILRKFHEIPERDIAASIVSFEEQLRGWLEVIRRVEQSDKLPLAYRSLSEMQRYFCRITIVGFDAGTQLMYQNLRKEHRRLGSFDLRIAASALALDAILVTRNLCDFSQIPSLTIQDWTIG